MNLDRPSALRVLHLCAGNLYGGVERIVAECAASRGLSATMQPAFAVCFEGRLARELEQGGVPCVRLGAVRVSLPHTIWRARRALGAELRRLRPDVVVCHSVWMYAIAAPVVRAVTGDDTSDRASIVLWLHDPVTGRTWAERWARLSAPDLVISNSRFTDLSAPVLYPSAPRRVLYAPVSPRHVDDSSRPETRRALGVDDRTPVIVLASRMAPWKGHAALIRALTSIPLPWHVWIAGGAQRISEHAYERELRALADGAGARDRIQFLGQRRDVPLLMRAADIHCQPNSGPEPFGLAFVEALYAGLPVVTTALGGALEIVTDACGVLLPPDDEAALRSALERLIASPGERRRLGAAGPARAAELCDPATQLGTLANLLERLRCAGAMT